MGSANILTSLHGRLFGLDKDGFLHSRDNDVHDGSTAVNIPPGGLTRLAGTTAQAFNIDKPVPGLVKRLVASGTSTARTITLPSGCTVLSTGGSTHNTITMLTAGQALTLQGLSTAVYMVVMNQGAATFSLV
jgi:hypothetical protein